MTRKIFTKKEKETYIGWVILIALAFIFFVGLIFQNCIFEWPIRWDFKTCVKEQWPKAVEEAVKVQNKN